MLQTVSESRYARTYLIQLDQSQNELQGRHHDTKEKAS